MKRILLVARTEFLALVRTKAFIVGLLTIPTLGVLALLFQSFAARQTDNATHRVAVIDETAVLYGALAEDAAARQDRSGDAGGRRRAEFVLETAPAGGDRTATLADLSHRLQTGELFAFVVLPASLIDAESAHDEIAYYTDTPTYTALPDWLQATVTDTATRYRLDRAGLDRAEVSRLMRSAAIATLRPLRRDDSGQVVPGVRTSDVRTFVLPIGLMYLLAVAVMSAAPPLLTAVVEEKMNRISEVLIAAISPFQLMAGKLLGVTAVAVLLATLLIGSGVYGLTAAGQTHLIDGALVLWFALFLCLAVLLYGAIFIAIGAACSDLKDAHAMMPPVVLALFLPLLGTPALLDAPTSTFATILTLIPTATPFLMLGRLAVSPAPPMWQVAVGVALTSATTVIGLAVAGRIFRIGLLMQGKPPNLPELLRWIRQP